MPACSVHSVCLETAQCLRACSVHNVCLQREHCVCEVRTMRMCSYTMRACTVHNVCVQCAQWVRAVCTVRAEWEPQEWLIYAQSAHGAC